jgi:uncharacterized membrane protein
MTLPALYLTVLRVIHIFAAVTWVGGGIFLVSVLTPTVQAAGPDGGRFMLRLAAYGRLAQFLTGSSIATVVAGALLFWPTSGGLNPAWLTTPQGVFLTIGAIIGILAMLHGAFVTGPTTRKLGAVANDILARQGPPPPELMQQAQALGAKISSGAVVSVTMAALALFFMAAAQTI